MPLVDALDDARLITPSITGRTLEFMRWTRPQRLWMSETAQLALWLDGNQLGKTTATHGDMLHRCRGTHPYQKTPKPPINAIVLGDNWPQMSMPGGFLEKLWDLVPKGEIDSKITFTKGHGFNQKIPKILFVRGPGAGSAISFGTFVAGPKRIQGATIDIGVSDEPLPPDVYEEFVPRIMQRGGVIRMNFTPRTGMPNMSEMKKRVEAGIVHLHQYGLMEENCWPEGDPAPYMSQAAIDFAMGALPATVRRMRQFGDWSPVRTDLKLYNFSREFHVRDERPPPGAWLCVCIDHGTGTGRQGGALIAMTDVDTHRPRVWVWDQAYIPIKTSTHRDALVYRDMLERNGVDWRQVDCWVGDRRVMSSKNQVLKGNRELRAALAPLFGVSVDDFAQIEKPSKWAGSPEHWLDQWNSMLGDFDRDSTPHCIIHPRCERVIRFAEEHEGKPADPLKDIGDAVRYGIEKGIGERSLPAGRFWRQ